MGFNSGFKGLSTQVRGFTGAETVRIIQGEKFLSAPSFRGEVKLSVPCCRFAACKRSLNGMWKSTFRQNYWLTFSPTVPPFAARISHSVWTWRHLAAEVGTSKPQGVSGLHNKPIGCSASGACAPGPVEEEEEGVCLRWCTHNSHWRQLKIQALHSAATHPVTCLRSPECCISYVFNSRHCEQ